MELGRARQRYGAYTVDANQPYKDTDGQDFPGCLSYVGEFGSPETLEIHEKWPELGKLTAMLRVVANNGPNSIGGGGPPAVPGACFPAELE